MLVRDYANLRALNTAFDWHESRPRNILARVHVIKVVTLTLKLLFFLLYKTNELGCALLDLFHQICSLFLTIPEPNMQVYALIGQFSEVPDYALLKWRFIFHDTIVLAVFGACLLFACRQVSDADLVHNSLISCLKRTSKLFNG